jgi:hypothetical protein
LQTPQGANNNTPAANRTTRAPHTFPSGAFNKPSPASHAFRVSIGVQPRRKFNAAAGAAECVCVYIIKNNSALVFAQWNQESATLAFQITLRVVHR